MSWARSMNCSFVGAMEGSPVFSNYNYILIKKKMKKNMGTIDKVIRILVAVAVAILFFTNVITGVIGIVLIALAAIFVITSLISFCPLYLPLGINTANKR